MVNNEKSSVEFINLKVDYGLKINDAINYKCIKESVWKIVNHHQKEMDTDIQNFAKNLIKQLERKK